MHTGVYAAAACIAIRIYIPTRIIHIAVIRELKKKKLCRLKKLGCTRIVCNKVSINTGYSFVTLR